MYQRIVLKDLTKLTDGNTSLPSVLNITNNHYFSNRNVSQLNGQVFSRSGRLMTVEASEASRGTIGNNSYEFGIEFGFEDFLSPSVSMDSIIAKYSTNTNTNTKQLYKYIYDDSFMSISSKFLFDNFIIFELNDYSCQAMTSGHYDYDVKVFFKLKKDDTIEYKFPKAFTTTIKSYTKKKVWVLIDRSILRDNNLDDDTIQKFFLSKIIIDFKYKFNDFSEINSSWNVAGLFDPIENSSAYHDSVVLTNNSDSVLNQQNEYFSYTYDSNKDRNSKKYDNIEYKKIVKRLYSDQAVTTDINKFKTKLIENTNTIYDNKSSYEIYKFIYTEDKKNPIFGERVLEQSENSIYEIYPVPANFIHYVFTNKNKIETVDELRKAMQAKHYYLHNYNIQNINTFNIGGTSYVETYIPVPYTDIVNKKDNLVLSKNDKQIERANNYKYSGTYYDPENLSSDGALEADYLLPYFGADNFVDKVVGAPYIVDINKNTSNVLDYRNNLTDDFNVIACVKDGTLPNNDTQIKITTEKPNADGQLESVNAEINSLRTEIPTLNNDAQYILICNNLYKLITKTESKITLSNKTITVNDCLFAYFSSEENELKIKKIYKHKDISANLDVYKSYVYYIKPIANTNVFIIPSEDNLLKVEILNSSTLSSEYYKVY